MRFPAELRYAVRTLARAPAFALVAVATLALGVGATATIFSVVRGVLLEPLPYPAPDRIVQLWQIGDEGQEMAWSEPNFQDVRDQSRSYGSVAAYAGTIFTVTGSGESTRVPGAVVSDDFFSVLGVAPVLGRGLLPADHAETAPVVLVSHGYWQSQLGGDPEVLGRSLQLGGSAHTVVGVLPSRRGFPAEAQLWIPRTPHEGASRTGHNWRAIARLADGVTLDQAQRELAALGARLKSLHGDDTWMASGAVVPLQEELVGNVRPALLVLLAAAGLLLLIACANVTNLLLARAATRRRELAVRLALGADRSRLLRQVLAESTVLALAAGVAGSVLAIWGVDLLMAVEPGRLPRLDTVGVDGVVLAFTVGISTVAALGIGLASTFLGTRSDVREALTEGGRGGTGGPAGSRWRAGLVAAQVALTVVLLIGAGLLSRSFIGLITLDPGYRTSGALAMEITLPPADNVTDDPLIVGTANARAAAVVDALLARLCALPGVTAAGGANMFPLTGGGANGMFLVLERPDELQSFDDWARLTSLPGRTGFADYRVATPGYFEAMEIPLLRGRLFDEGDVRGAPHVAVISAALAEAQWPDEDPIGKLIQFGNMDGVLHPFTVVGVVGDVRDRSLERAPQPALYGNAVQRSTMLNGRFHIVLAANVPPASLITGAREIVAELTAGGPVEVQTMEEVFSASLAERRFSLLLLGVFGVTALILAAMGIYGMISFAVTQRTREVGIRMAVGAEQSAILRMMLREGMVLMLIGLGAGLVVSYAATRVLAAQLYGVGALDPVTFAGVSVLLTAAALIASYGPARRATAVDPVIALNRSD